MKPSRQTTRKQSFAIARNRCTAEVRVGIIADRLTHIADDGAVRWPRKLSSGQSSEKSTKFCHSCAGNPPYVAVCHVHLGAVFRYRKGQLLPYLPPLF